MEGVWGSGDIPHAFLTSAVDGDEWSTSCFDRFISGVRLEWPYSCVRRCSSRELNPGSSVVCPHSCPHATSLRPILILPSHLCLFLPKGLYLSGFPTKILYAFFTSHACYVGLLISLWLFLFPIFLFAAQPEEFFLDGLKKLEERSYKCVELRGNM
jgi:hypothetical protein